MKMDIKKRRIEDYKELWKDTVDEYSSVDTVGEFITTVLIHTIQVPFMCLAIELLIRDDILAENISNGSFGNVWK